MRRQIIFNHGRSMPITSGKMKSPKCPLRWLIVSVRQDCNDSPFDQNLIENDFETDRNYWQPVSREGNPFQEKQTKE
jgi:hypothetical protein